MKTKRTWWISRALGTSHTTIYRHFRSKAEVFDAIVSSAMRDEEALASAFVDGQQPASERLQGLVLALHHRKRERFASDPEVYELYRRVLDERPELVTQYAETITRLIAAILAEGVKQREFKIETAAGLPYVRYQYVPVVPVVETGCPPTVPESPPQLCPTTQRPI